MQTYSRSNAEYNYEPVNKHSVSSKRSPSV